MSKPEGIPVYLDVEGNLGGRAPSFAQVVQIDEAAFNRGMKMLGALQSLDDDVDFLVDHGIYPSSASAPFGRTVLVYPSANLFKREVKQLRQMGRPVPVFTRKGKVVTIDQPFHRIAKPLIYASVFAVEKTTGGWQTCRSRWGDPIRDETYTGLEVARMVRKASVRCGAPTGYDWRYLSKQTQHGGGLPGLYADHLYQSPPCPALATEVPR